MNQPVAIERGHIVDIVQVACPDVRGQLFQHRHLGQIRGPVCVRFLLHVRGEDPVDDIGVAERLDNRPRYRGTGAERGQRGQQFVANVGRQSKHSATRNEKN